MPECEGCGAHITARFARVFGDNEDTVSVCLDCSSFRDMTGIDR